MISSSVPYFIIIYNIMHYIGTPKCIYSHIRLYVYVVHISFVHIIPMYYWGTKEESPRRDPRSCSRYIRAWLCEFVCVYYVFVCLYLYVYVFVFGVYICVCVYTRFMCNHVRCAPEPSDTVNPFGPSLKTRSTGSRTRRQYTRLIFLSPPPTPLKRIILIINNSRWRYYCY